MPKKKTTGRARSNNIATAAIAQAEQAIEDEKRICENGPQLEITQRELDELELLAYFLGASRSSCINFAVNLSCKSWLYSANPIRLPKPLKTTSTNPLAKIPYQLNPEVQATLKKAKANNAIPEDLAEPELTRRAVAYLCKRILPPKNQRRLTDE